LFIVNADALPIVALEPWRSPSAPKDNVFSWGRLDTIAKRSTFDMRVDVRDSFCNGIMPGDWKSDRGWRTRVNDKSRRCKFGHIEINGCSEESEREV